MWRGGQVGPVISLLKDVGPSLGRELLLPLGPGDSPAKSCQFWEFGSREVGSWKWDLSLAPSCITFLPPCPPIPGLPESKRTGCKVPGMTEISGRSHPAASRSEGLEEKGNGLELSGGFSSSWLCPAA